MQSHHQPAVTRVPAMSALCAAVGIVLLCASPSEAQRCLHGADESSPEQARRQAAERFVTELNGAQVRLQRERGTYGALSELRGLQGPPVGFVPRLVSDRFGYMIRVNDVLDACGFALFSDEHGVVYQARPSGREMPQPVDPERREPSEADDDVDQ